MLYKRKWKGLREIHGINLISTNSIETNPKILKHHLFEKKIQQPFLWTSVYLAPNVRVVSAQISTNVWSWMAAATPSAPIRKEAMSAAAVRGMHWCQMGDRVQVQKRYTKYACYSCSVTNVAPDLVAESRMEEMCLGPREAILAFTGRYLCVIRYRWVWKQSWCLWRWPVYQHSWGVPLPLLRWLHGFNGHENMHRWVSEVNGNPLLFSVIEAIIQSEIQWLPHLPLFPHRLTCVSHPTACCFFFITHWVWLVLSLCAWM